MSTLVLASADPIAPRENAEIGPRRIGQHCDELQQVVIRVMEENRSCRHPCQHNRFLCWSTVKVPGLNAGLLQSCRRLMQIRNCNSEGHVEADTHRHDSRLPKTKHCLPGNA